MGAMSTTNSGRSPSVVNPFSLLRKKKELSVEEKELENTGGLLQILYTYEGDSLEKFVDLEKLLIAKDFDLLFAMIPSVPFEDCVWFSNPLISVLSQREALMDFLEAALKREIESTGSVGLLLRGQNLLIKVLSGFMDIVGKKYLDGLLQSFIQEVSRDWHSVDVEVDPDKCLDGQNTKEALPYLIC
uniref:Ras-GAP domain-containing protein n=1 Tax=Paramoeba aestuarina TaxID=180227 RepID=A0A7S4PH43_9EUKA|mmetsp:Transcript_6133/g.9291  ORF Transcript_6133/g.9291 Transcript_6133/m.9291 type:complete len:187 (+) Transcript_6133:1-561(+)